MPISEDTTNVDSLLGLQRAGPAGPRTKYFYVGS
jgi:hypothetical protein